MVGLAHRHGWAGRAVDPRPCVGALAPLVARRRLAFRRIPAGADGLPFTPQRAGQPWSIRVADLPGGAGRQVWIADTGRGSVFREIVAPNQIVWGGGDRIVFPW